MLTFAKGHAGHRNVVPGPSQRAVAGLRLVEKTWVAATPPRPSWAVSARPGRPNKTQHLHPPGGTARLASLTAFLGRFRLQNAPQTCDFAPLKKGTLAPPEKTGLRRGNLQGVCNRAATPVQPWRNHPPGSGSRAADKKSDNPTSPTYHAPGPLCDTTCRTDTPKKATPPTRAGGCFEAFGSLWCWQGPCTRLDNPMMPPAGLSCRDMPPIRVPVGVPAGPSRVSRFGPARLMRTAPTRRLWVEHVTSGRRFVARPRTPAPVR